MLPGQTSDIYIYIHIKYIYIEVKNTRWRTTQGGKYVCMYVCICMCVCMYMYVCMYVYTRCQQCMFVYVFVFLFLFRAIDTTVLGQSSQRALQLRIAEQSSELLGAA